MNKGFTLIELLVVISIISLLSSITLSSIQSARDRADIAAGLQFENNLTKKLYLDAYYIIGEVDGSMVANDGIDNQSGILTDVSLSNNGINGTAYIFNQNNSRITFNYPDSYRSTTRNSDFTFSAWIYPYQLSDESPIICSQRSSSACFLIDTDKLKLMIDDAYLESGNVLEANTWQHVAGIYKWQEGAGWMQLYLNGKLIAEGQNSRGNNYIRNVSSDGNMYIGYSSRDGLEFNGIIDEPKMFNGSI